MTGPVIITDRLVLRVPEERDVAPGCAFWASERSHMMGGPWTAGKCREEFQGLWDQWAKHGFSLFTVMLKGSDQGIGGIGPFFPDSHPEPEFGWSLWSADHEGKGFAFEAASAARDWFFATTDYDRAVSYTDPANHRSHRLCERMGAVLDPAVRYPYEDGPVVVYRHRRPA